jgi:hypothetical protein
MTNIYIPVKHREGLDSILDQFVITHEEVKDLYPEEFAAAEYLLNKLQMFIFNKKNNTIITTSTND